MVSSCCKRRIYLEKVFKSASTSVPCYLVLGRNLPPYDLKLINLKAQLKRYV